MMEIGKDPMVLEGIYSILAYGYFAVAFAVLFYWIYQSKVSHKFEIFIIGFYLMTGNINHLLTVKIPGLSLFEIQPERFILFAFSFFLCRYIYYSDKTKLKFNWTVPWFQVFLMLFAIVMILSQYRHVSILGMADVVVNSLYPINFILILIVLRIILDEASLLIIGKAVLFGGVVTTLVSLIQLGLDPMFMRIGDQRIAFGELLRSNGIFTTEYYNAYFIITAIAWTLVTIEKPIFRYLLLFLFVLGVVATFQRMSWVVLCLVLFIHFIFIEKMDFGKLVLTGTVGLAMVLTIGIFFNKEIRNSPLVKERLSESVDSRGGYYKMVLDNIWRQPVWGFGGKNNEVYYYAMLQVTRLRERATGEQGGIHNGYLATMFYYGIPAFVLFVFFVVSVVWYFMKLIRHHLFFSIPFLLALIFMMSNLTNSLLFWTYLAHLVAIHLGVGLGAKRIFFEDKKEEEEKYTSVVGATEQDLELT